MSSEHDYYLDDNVCEITLRSISHNQPDPISETERACLARYSRPTTDGHRARRFSPAAHIKNHLHALASHDHYWSSDNARDTDEHNHLKYLSVLYTRMENWEPKDTIGTPMEQFNPIKNFESQWLEVQKFYLKGGRCLFVTASTASSRACRVMPVQVVLMDESSQIKEVDTINKWPPSTLGVECFTKGMQMV